MCMWQSQALAGALSFGASVPDDHGTPSARLSRAPNPADIIAAPAIACSSVRRCMVVSIISFLPNCSGDDIVLLGLQPYLRSRIMRARAMRSTSIEPSVIIMLRWSRKKRSIGSSFDSPMPP
jgi:hypothetical protein